LHKKIDITFCKTDSEDQRGGKETESLAHIKYGREKITRDIIEAAANRTLELGIELKDNYK